MKKILLLILFVSTTTVYGQGTDQYVELLRSDVNTERVAIITEAMAFSDAESTVFWPIYREYELELSKIGDERIALIKDFAAHYEMMTDEKAKELAEGSFKIEEKRTKLRKSYYKKMNKELSATQVAKFFQVDGLLNKLIDLQISSELPLIDSGSK